MLEDAHRAELHALETRECDQLARAHRLDGRRVARRPVAQKGGSNAHWLPGPEPERLWFRGGQRRDAGQRGRHRNQNLWQRLVLDDPRQSFERYCIVEVESPNLSPSQLLDMRQAAKQLSQITSDRAHVSALAAGHAELAVIGIGAPDELELVDPDLARRKLDLLAATRNVVGALTQHLDRRVLRRNLLDQAFKPGERVADRVVGR